MSYLEMLLKLPILPIEDHLFADRAKRLRR